MRFVVALLLSVRVAFCATYYVDVSTDPSGDGSQGNPWDALADATSTVVAGDTVRVAAGTYAESPTESTDGTLGNYITYVADGTVTITGLVTLSGDYIRFIGFTIDRNFGGTEAISIVNAVGVEVWNCTLREYTRNGMMMDSGGAANASHRCVIVGNTFQGTFGTAGTDAESRHMAIRGNANFVAFNTFNKLNIDGIYWFGASNRFVGNYGFDANSNSAAHCDFFQTGTDAGVGNTYTLFESNFYVDSDVPAEDHHLYNLSNTGTDFTHCIFRGNVTHQIGQNQIFGDWSNFYVYGETFVDSCRLASDASLAYFSVFGLSASVENVRVYNNIMVDTWGSSATTLAVWYTGGGASFLHDYNLAFDSNHSVTFTTPFSAEANSLFDVDPLLTSQSTDDFTLGASSPARNAGTALTLANGGGTGTDVTVDDAGFFRGDQGALDVYSGNLVTGDTVTIGTDAVTITSIAGNVLTVTPSITWADNDPVYWGTDTTPDLGAFPGSHVKLTSATYSVAGNDYTVTPVGDARFVVFYQDAVPHTVDNSSPYTATIASGAVTIRAYALRASTTPTVLATAATAGTPTRSGSVNNGPRIFR